MPDYQIALYALLQSKVMQRREVWQRKIRAHLNSMAARQRWQSLRGPSFSSLGCDPNRGKPPNSLSSTTALGKNLSRSPPFLLPRACAPRRWGACACPLHLLGPQTDAMPLAFTAPPLRNLLRMRNAQSGDGPLHPGAKRELTLVAREVMPTHHATSWHIPSEAKVVKSMPRTSL